MFTSGTVSFICLFVRYKKEERFLFPIYPFFCLCGAVTLTEVQVCILDCLVLFISLHKATPESTHTSPTAI